MFGLKEKAMASMAKQMKGFLPEPSVIKEKFADFLPIIFKAITENVLESQKIPRETWDQYMIGFKSFQGKPYLFIFWHDKNMNQIQAKGFEELEKLIQAIPDDLIRKKIDEIFDQIGENPTAPPAPDPQGPSKEFKMPEIPAQIHQDPQPEAIETLASGVVDQMIQESEDNNPNPEENDTSELATDNGDQGTDQAGREQSGSESPESDQ